MQLLRDIAINNFKGLQSVTLEDCGQVNTLIGKNNSGKSSILHAIDMAGLALAVKNWNSFRPKLDIKDLFSDVGVWYGLSAKPTYCPRHYRLQLLCG